MSEERENKNTTISEETNDSNAKTSIFSKGRLKTIKSDTMYGDISTIVFHYHIRDGSLFNPGWSKYRRLAKELDDERAKSSKLQAELDEANSKLEQLRSILNENDSRDSKL